MEHPKINYIEMCAEAVRQFLFEELSSKYKCQLGSTHKDLSYTDFSDAIMVDYKGLPIHIDVYSLITMPEIIVDIHIPPFNSSGRSHKHRSCFVDLSAPNYGKLFEVVERDLREAMREMDADLPYIND